MRYVTDKDGNVVELKPLEDPLDITGVQEVTFAVDKSQHLACATDEFIDFVKQDMPKLDSVVFEEEYSLWLNSHNQCFVDLSGKRRLGKITKLNAHTIWVKIMIGASTHIIIKRHIDKHHVRWR